MRDEDYRQRKEKENEKKNKIKENPNLKEHDDRHDKPKDSTELQQ